MARDGFIFYKSFYEAISRLEDDNNKVKVYEAICRYGLYGDIPEVKGIPGALFVLVKPQIDANNARYENGIKGGEYGNLGGRPRREENPEQTPNKPQENPTKTPKEKDKEKEKEKEKEKDIPPIVPLKGELERLFEIFWTEYPKKRSKGDALKAFKALKPSSELVATMCEALARAKTCSDWKKDGGQYIPYPGTWLRARGWEDEYTQPLAPKNKHGYIGREYSDEDLGALFENQIMESERIENNQ